MTEPEKDSDLGGMQLFACGRAHILLPKEWTIGDEPNNTVVATPPSQNWTLRVSPIFVDADPSVIRAAADDIANRLAAEPLLIDEKEVFYAAGERDGATHHSYVLPRDSLVFIATLSFKTGEVDSGEANDYLRSMLPLFFESDE
jgi:hypothetical protein